MSAVLLLPSYGLIHRPHINSLANCGRELIYLEDSAQIDIVRCLLIEKGLQTDHDVFVFVDSDISFEKDDLDRLIKNCEDTQEIVSGLYISKKGNGQIVMTVLPNGGTKTDREDGLLPVFGVGMGFCAIHRKALQKIAQQMERVRLPIGLELQELYPFFLSIIDNGIYYGEDYAFCVRAHKAGVTVHFNHTIHVTHWGMRPHKFQS